MQEYYSITHSVDSDAQLVKKLVDDFHQNTSDKILTNCYRLSTKYKEYVISNEEAINNELRHERDYNITYFGFQTLLKSYLLDFDKQKERPQCLYMRISLSLTNSLQEAFKVYHLLSLHYISMATPIMLNAGTINCQLSSCFQLATKDDLSELFDTIKNSALISKWSGGVSLWLHNIRAEGSIIKKTGGKTSGIKNYIKILNDVQIYVDQGGKRPGAFAMYLSVDHDDIFTFLKQGRLKGEEATQSLNAPDLKYALWVSDLFMKTLQSQINGGDGSWYLFSPDDVPLLHTTYGDEYEKLYMEYVKEKKYRRCVKAGDIIQEAYKSWMQIGNPYVLYKDAINKKSNMKNVGIIQSSNLCVSGDTFVMTKDGHVPIEYIYQNNQYINKKTIIWNGYEWRYVQIEKTSDKSALLGITLSDGTFIKCTLFHKFYICNESRKTKIVKHNEHDDITIPNETDIEALFDKEEETYAKNLTEGMILQTCKFLPYDASFIPKITNYTTCSKGIIVTCVNAHKEKLYYQMRGISVIIIDKITILFNYNAIKILNKFYNADLPKPRIKYVEQVYVKKISMIEGSHPTYCFVEEFKHRAVFNGIYTGQCSEVIIPSSVDNKEYGVCNLGAICLKHFNLDYKKIYEASYQQCVLLNNTIDINNLPCVEGKNSNLKHRPIGIGIIGLADVFQQCKLEYGSIESQKISRAISASIYYGALKSSCELAKKDGKYESFDGSPMSFNILQPDMWKDDYMFLTNNKTWEEEIEELTNGIITRNDWKELRNNISMHGIRNSYLIAYMPTATTSNIIGQNECFEPITSNIYTRKTLAGEFIIVNKYLLKELQDLSLWNNKIRRQIINNGGSIANEDIPQEIKNRYKTAREIHPSLLTKVILSMAPFVCQSISTNLFLNEPCLPKILRFLFENWKGGLKTGLYYSHTSPAIGTQKTCTSCVI